MVILYLSTPLPNFCLVLVVQLCCGTPCRFTGDMPTVSKLVLRLFLVSHTLRRLHHPKRPHQCHPLESPPPLCLRNLHCSYALTAKHVTRSNIEIFCFNLQHNIKGDHFQSMGFSSMNLQYTAALDCMSLKDVTKHLFVVQTNVHIFTIIFQQTCSPQINSLSAFTVVNKLFQPASSGVMEFVIWCLQQFSEAARLFSVPLYFYSERKRDSKD